jgi:hypothetical protein
MQFNGVAATRTLPGFGVRRHGLHGFVSHGQNLAQRSGIFAACKDGRTSPASQTAHKLMIAVRQINRPGLVFSRAGSCQTCLVIALTAMADGNRSSQRVFCISNLYYIILIITTLHVIQTGG